MIVKTVCPPDCTGRYPGCGSNCKTFKEHRAKKTEEYKRTLTNQKVGTVLYDGWRKTARE